MTPNGVTCSFRFGSVTARRQARDGPDEVLESMRPWVHTIYRRGARRRRDGREARRDPSTVPQTGRRVCLLVVSRVRYLPLSQSRSPLPLGANRQRHSILIGPASISHCLTLPQQRTEIFERTDGPCGCSHPASPGELRATYCGIVYWSELGAGAGIEPAAYWL